MQKIKIRSHLILIFLSCTLSIPTFAQQNSRVNTLKCKVEFSPDQANVDIAAVNNCFDHLENQTVISIDIFTMPTPDPKKPKNGILWLNRTNALKKVLNSLFPNVKINGKTGENIPGLQRGSLLVATVKKDFIQSSQQSQNNFQTELPQSDASSADYSEETPKVTERPIKKTGCPVCKRILNQNFGTKIWGGLNFFYLSAPLSNYVNSFFNGTLVGLSQNIVQLTSANNLYASVVSNIGASVKKVTIAFQALPIKTNYYFMNIELLGGVEHHFGYRPLSVYLDAGLSLNHIAFFSIQDTDKNTVNSYNVFLSYNITGNLGLNYNFEIVDNFGILLKLNVNAIAGSTVTKDIFSSTGKSIEQVNLNPIIVIPSISIGAVF